MPCATPPSTGRASLLRAGLCAPVLTALLLTTLPAQAQWKWRDANGQITASDLPPPRSVPDKDVLQRPDPNARRAPVVPSAAASAPVVAVPGKPPVDKDLEARRRAGDAEAQAKAKVEEEKQAQLRADNCRRAKGHLAALDSGQRMARTNDKGEREILDDKGRAEERRRANEVVASDCR